MVSSTHLATTGLSPVWNTLMAEMKLAAFFSLARPFSVSRTNLLSASFSSRLARLLDRIDIKVLQFRHFISTL